MPQVKGLQREEGEEGGGGGEGREGCGTSSIKFRILKNENQIQNIETWKVTFVYILRFNISFL